MYGTDASSAPKQKCSRWRDETNGVLTDHLSSSAEKLPFMAWCGLRKDVPPWAAMCLHGQWRASRPKGADQLAGTTLTFSWQLPDEEDVHFAQTFQWLTDLCLVVLGDII